jgi:hypothetical protein
MASLSLPSIEIVFSKSPSENSEGGTSSNLQNTNQEKYKTSTGKTVEICKKTGAVICKATGKVIKKTAIVWPIKVLLGILDIIAIPFSNMAGKDLNFSKLWKVGCGIIVLAFWLYYLMHSGAAIFFKEIGLGEAGANKLALIAQIIVPGGLTLMGLSMILGGMKMQMGRTFIQKYGMGLEPLPAFESGVIFRIGDVQLSLRDTHTGIGAFGGIGSGKTVSLMVPMMRQFFRQLRDEDDNSEFAKCGALILDEKGDFIDSTITEMMLANRSLQDLVIIDPDLDLYRYNPLDPNQTADENAAKLAKVQKILGTSSGGDNAYWDQTSQMTIKYFLQLLEVYKPKHKIGLDDIARFMRDDELAGVLCDTVEKVIEEKKQSNEISEEAYGMYTDAISSTRNAWIQLNPNTKSTLKTTITNMLGPIASNPRLQKVFCRDTNFSFRDLPNRGKIVLFRGSGIDKSTARLICVCLKIDFQTWQKRRNGSAAAAFGLNTNRTVVFICDEYQEFVTCGGEGDETFYGVSRSTRTAPIVATQSYNSLETAIKNKEQTKTLRQNIATWVFFRSTDQDTCELGKFLAGQSKKEDFSTSQDTTGFLETASNLGGGGGNKGSSISISKKLEENFRTDDFSRLVTMTMEKSKSGPWYSEAIIYHYHDTDDSAESRCYKTRLPHLYYDNKLRKQASLNVRHLDFILYDRNWQRKAMQRGLLMIQRSVHESARQKKEDIESRRGKSEVITAKEKAEKSEKESDKLKRVSNLVQSTQKEIAKDRVEAERGALGEIEMDEELTREGLNDRVRQLKERKEATSDQAEAHAIQIQIDAARKLINRFALLDASELPDTKKEVLRADRTPYDFDSSDEYESDNEDESHQTHGSIEYDEETLEALATQTNPDGEENNTNSLRRRSRFDDYSYEEDDEDSKDELWEVSVMEAGRKADISTIEGIPLGVIDRTEGVEDPAEVEVEEIETGSSVGSSASEILEYDEDEKTQDSNQYGIESKNLPPNILEENNQEEDENEDGESDFNSQRPTEGQTQVNKSIGLFSEDFPESYTSTDNQNGEEDDNFNMDNFIGGFEGLGSSEGDIQEDNSQKPDTSRKSEE